MKIKGGYSGCSSNAGSGCGCYHKNDNHSCGRQSWVVMETICFPFQMQVTVQLIAKVTVLCHGIILRSICLIFICLMIATFTQLTTSNCKTVSISVVDAFHFSGGLHASGQI